MPRQDQAILIVEIGTITTRVSLIDMVAGEARLIGRSEVPSTIEPPQENGAVAILAAAAEIGEMTERRLVENNQLVMPQNAERDGLEQVIVITSAAPRLSVVIAAITADISGRSAERATRATYANVIQTIALDHTGQGQEKRDPTWFEQQVQVLTGLRPDVVLIAGGLEEGAEDALLRLAHIVGLTSLATRVEADGAQRQDIAARQVIFVGNQRAAEQVHEALSGRAHYKTIENIRPALDREQLGPLRAELNRLYDERMIPLLPGAQMLRRLSSTPLRTAVSAGGLIVRFVSELNKRRVLAIDVGSAAIALHYAGDGEYVPTVLAATGTGLGLGTLMAERGLALIGRWLPFMIGERELTHRLLNKMLRPQLQPTTQQDLLIEHAVVREAMALALAAFHEERPGVMADLVIVGGGVLAHAPHPGMAVLAVLDGLQDAAIDTPLALDVHADTLGLLHACGALAYANPEAALSLFEHDLLRNTPLATCVVGLGGGTPGSPAIEAELRFSDAPAVTVSVAHGQIARLPLEPHQRAQLVLRPAPGVRIGRNAPGAEVSSEIGAVVGSALGVVIDARGRPVVLPEDAAVRQQLIWDWLAALGAVSGPLPFEQGAALPETAPAMLPAVRPSADMLVPAADGPPNPESDLARLRQTVAEPKKRGLFGRK